VLTRRCDGAGRVSIVVPARNEAERIGPLLDSLRVLRYPDYTVLVVDDGSTDGTADLVRAAGFELLSIDGPAPGWAGKPHACAVGAAATESEWLLFTDADTVHGRESLGRALAHARLTDADLLSLLPRQICLTFWERLLLPYTYALYFAGTARANRPGGPAVANGQYLLFRRTAYEAMGGHGSVRNSIIEDVALAREMRQNGYSVVLAHADDAVSVRMYRSLAEFWEGFGKNAARFVIDSPRTGIPTALAGLAWGVPLLRTRRLQPSMLVPALLMVPWDDEFGVPRRYALLYPLAATVFQLLAFDSLRKCLRSGSTLWKGRRY